MGRARPRASAVLLSTAVLAAAGGLAASVAVVVDDEPGERVARSGSSGAAEGEGDNGERPRGGGAGEGRGAGASSGREAAAGGAGDPAGVPRRVAELMRRMPLERKVAQLLLVGFEGTDLTAPVFQRLSELDLGGLVFESENFQDADQLSALAGESTAIAREAGHVSPWLMTSQEGGEFSELPGLPPPKVAAQVASAEEAGSAAARTGQALARVGLNGVLAPVLDVGLESGGAVGPRAFSDDPTEVERYAIATVRAFRTAGLTPVAKHFPGLGSASQPTDEGPAIVGLSLAELKERDMLPFRAAVRAGVPAIMLSHAAYEPDDFVTPGSLSPAIATALLRDELGFRGIAITDDLAAPAITATASIPDASIEALRAGADMLFISGSEVDQQAAHRKIVDAVRKRRLPAERIDEALRRVLTAKDQAGLLS